MNNCILLFLVAITTAPVSNAQCTGSTSSGVYNVSWAVSGGNVDFTVSAETTGWVGIGFSLTPNMPDSDVVVGATDVMSSFVDDRWASGRFLPPFDTQQNLENTEINIEDGRSTMSFRRALVTTDDNNQDLDLNQCVHLLRAWGGSVSSYNSPASFGMHNNSDVFETQLCLQDCVGLEASSMTSSSLEFTFTPSSVQVQTMQMTPSPVIDACSSNPCDQICTVIDGGFECSCMEGFVLESDGRSCEGLEASSMTPSSLEFTFTPSSVQVQTVQMTPSPVIDACSSNPCDQICTVIDRGFECSCMEGFVLESDGTTCEGLEASSMTPSSLEFTFTPSSVQVQTVQMTPSPVIDACSSNPCDQICTVIDGGFECSCMEGFVLESNGTSCEGLEASSMTPFSLEFTFTPSSVQVQTVQMTPSPVIDACSSNPCDQICTVIDGGFECSCMEGLVLEPDGRSCEVQVQTVQMTPSPVIEACSSNPCGQICTVIDGGFECSCMEGFVLEPDGTSCEELMILELQNRVSLRLINETRETFTEGKQYLFRNATARAMNNYCRRNPDDCGIITDDGARSFKKRLIPRTLLPLLKRQDTVSVSASNVIIVSIVNTSDGLQVTFFIRIMSGVISAQTIADAVQEAIDEGVYSTAGFTVTDVIIVDPTPTPDDDDDDDGLSGGQIAGIVIGVVVGVPLLLVILSLLAYCLGRQKNSKQRSGSVPQMDDEIAMKKVSLEDQGSVRSMKLIFANVYSDDEDEDEEEEEETRYN